MNEMKTPIGSGKKFAVIAVGVSLISIGIWKVQSRRNDAPVAKADLPAPKPLVTPDPPALAPNETWVRDFHVGQGRTYSVTTRQGLTTGSDAAKSNSVSGELSWYASQIDPRDGMATLRLNWKGAHGAKAWAKVTRLRDISEITMWTPALPADEEKIALYSMTKLFQPLPDPTHADRPVVVQEKEGDARSEVTYRIVSHQPDIQYERTKQRPLGAPATVSIVTRDGVAQINVNKTSGELNSVKGHEAYDIEVAMTKKIRIESSFEGKFLHAYLAKNDRPPNPWKSRAFVAVYHDRYAQHAESFSAAQWPKFRDELMALDKSPQAFEARETERRHALLQLSSLLRDHPELMKEYRALMAKIPNDSTQFRILVGALGYVATPEAQQFLRDLTSRPGLSESSRADVISQFATLNGKMTPETEAFLAKLSQQKDHVGTTSLLALGASTTYDPQSPAVQVIQNQWKSADLSRKRDLLAAVGNSGSPVFMPIIQDGLSSKDLLVRENAADALRAQRAPAAIAAMDTAWRNEKNETVRLNLLRSLEQWPDSDYRKNFVTSCSASAGTSAAEKTLCERIRAGNPH